MRILVIEDEDAVARRIAADIQRLGDTVIGPFDSSGDAITHLGAAEAAILGRHPGDGGARAMADRLTQAEKPFILLEGQVKPLLRMLPAHDTAGISRSMVIDLHARRLRSGRASAGDMLADMLSYARLRVSDRALAERLVENVMLRAISAVQNDPILPDLRAMVANLLDREIAAHSGRQLH